MPTIDGLERSVKLDDRARPRRRRRCSVTWQPAGKRERSVGLAHGGRRHPCPSGAGVRTVAERACSAHQVVLVILDLEIVLDDERVGRAGIRELAAREDDVIAHDGVVATAGLLRAEIDRLAEPGAQRHRERPSRSRGQERREGNDAWGQPLQQGDCGSGSYARHYKMHWGWSGAYDGWYISLNPAATTITRASSSAFIPDARALAPPGRAVNPRWR